MLAEDTFWRTVYRTREKLEGLAPEGYEARVQVYLGDERIEPEVGQLVPPWLFFYVEDEEHEAEPPRVVAVRPDQVRRVEIRLVRETGRRIGFQIRGPDDEPLAS